jgi:uncharacterized protein
LHDFVNLPKNDPQRKQASRLSADAACKWLSEINYDLAPPSEIYHVIEAHSFSAGIAPKSLEAKIVQDADRLDAVGAIGIARCFAVGGQLNRPIYDIDEPIARTRQLDDSKNCVDHFFVKLFKVIETLQTKAAKAEGERRKQYMQAYLEQLQSEL